MLRRLLPEKTLQDIHLRITHKISLEVGSQSLLHYFKFNFVSGIIGPPPYGKTFLSWIHNIELELHKSDSDGLDAGDEVIFRLKWILSR